MVTISQIRNMLSQGEIVTIPTKHIFLFMQECEKYPSGDERYTIRPKGDGRNHEVFDTRKRPDLK